MTTAFDMQGPLAASVYKAANEGMMITDAHKRILSVNPAFTRLTGFRSEEAIHRDPGELLRSGVHDRDFYKSLYEAIRKTGRWQGEIHNRHKDGAIYVHRQSIAEIRDNSGQLTHYIATFSDVTAIREAQRDACEQRDIVNALLDSLPGVLFLVDRQGHNHRCNKEARRYIGVDCTSRPREIAPFIDEADRDAVQTAIDQAFETMEPVSLKARVVSRGGRRTPLYISARPVFVRGEPFLCGLGIDISEQNALEEQLKRIAHTDTLTGCLNRAGFEGLISAEIARHQRYGSAFSLAMLDLDFFKAINDRFGHQTGDTVLAHFVELCREYLRDADVLCRWGGEEFIVLAPNTPLQGMQQLSQRLCGEIAENCAFGITVSIGITEVRSGDTVDDVIQRSDEALYKAKTGGRNRVCTVP